MTTNRDIARWRLQSQHLVAPHADSAAAVIQRLLAVQAENPSQAGWAGLYGARLDRATSLVVDSLSEQPDQTREQLADCLRGHGIEPDGQLLMLLLALLELDRLICSGRRL